jgi:hypothetical protein
VNNAPPAYGSSVSCRRTRASLSCRINHTLPGFRLLTFRDRRYRLSSLASFSNATLFLVRGKELTRLNPPRIPVDPVSPLTLGLVGTRISIDRTGEARQRQTITKKVNGLVVGRVDRGDQLRLKTVRHKRMAGRASRLGMSVLLKQLPSANPRS